MSPPGLPTVCCESKSTLKSTVHCESTVESKSTVVCQLTPTILLNLGLGHHRLFCPPGSFPQNHSSERKVGIFLSKKENGQKLFRSTNPCFLHFCFLMICSVGGFGGAPPARLSHVRTNRHQKPPLPPFYFHCALKKISLHATKPLHSGWCTVAQLHSGTVAHCAEALKEEERSVWLQKSRNPC